MKMIFDQVMQVDVETCVERLNVILRWEEPRFYSKWRLGLVFFD
jgi:hypothetical protein